MYEMLQKQIPAGRAVCWWRHFDLKARHCTRLISPCRAELKPAPLWASGKRTLDWQDNWSGRSHGGRWCPGRAASGRPVSSAGAAGLSVCCAVKHCSQSIPAPDCMYGGATIQHHCRPFVALTAIHSARRVLQLLHTANRSLETEKFPSTANHCAAECFRTRGVKKRRRWRCQRRDCLLGDATIRTTMSFSHWPSAGK